MAGSECGVQYGGGEMMASGGQAKDDVTVVGAGIFGLACAWEMARRGARVRVIEAEQIGAGASGGVVGTLAPHDPTAWNEKKQIQLDSLNAAPAFWAEVAAAGGVDPGYARSGRLQPLPNEAVVAARIAGAAAHWGGFRMWVAEAEGPLAPPGRWLADDLTARIAPRQALTALAAALRARGGEVVEGAGPLAPEDVGGTVLWATGAPGLATLGRDLGRVVGNGVKGQAALLAFDAGDWPQIYEDGLYVVPHADGTVAVGSTSEREFDGLGTDAALDALIERARLACPVLRDVPVVDRWAGVRPRATSLAPLLGAWPGRPGHWVANGGFKIGLGMAPWVAEAMADLVLEGRARVPEGWRVG